MAGPARRVTVCHRPERPVSKGSTHMARYMVTRSFPGGLEIPTTGEGAKACLAVVDNNSTEQVTWIQSFVSDDHSRTYCVYDGPSADSIRRAASLNGLPVDDVVQISVLDPYFYVSEAS